MSRHERTGWRDEALEDRHRVYGDVGVMSGWEKALSARHRAYGTDCPMADLDLIVTEYDNYKPVAFIDYKQRPTLEIGNVAREPSIQCLIQTGNLARRPVYVVAYRHAPTWQFAVTALNDLAVMQPPPMTRCAEVAYVRWLYWLRGRDLPDGIAAKLNTEPPSAPWQCAGCRATAGQMSATLCRTCAYDIPTQSHATGHHGNVDVDR